MPAHPQLAEVKSVALCVEGEATAGREAAWLEAPSQHGTWGCAGAVVAHIQPI